jgi:hypothetical protein
MMNEPVISMVRFSTDEEDSDRRNLASSLRTCPISDDELVENLGLFLNSKHLSRILFMDHLYKATVGLHGVIMDFGTRWGQNMALFSGLRGIYEPFNRNRKIVGFDTFEGFLKTTPEDGGSEMMVKGKYGVSGGYEEFLARILDIHERSNPLAHVRKYDIRKGDAAVELSKYLEQSPETIVSMAYFDMDLYEPTKECLLAIKDHLTKGSVIGFDELNAPECPGETLALKEVFGLDRYKIQRLPMTSRTSYIVID